MYGLVVKNMMGHKDKLKPDEYDLVTGWRRYLCYMINTSAPRKLKKQINRRNRRKAKQKGYDSEC